MLTKQEQNVYSALYMIRNRDVGDGEQGRFYEPCSDPKTGEVICDGMEYMNELPSKLREACKIVLDELDNYDIAIEIYCKWHLKGVGQVMIEEVGEVFRKEWMEPYEEDGDEEFIKSENECVDDWIGTAKLWTYR